MTEKMTTTMKNWNRKTIAIVLAVVMAFVVVSGAIALSVKKTSAEELKPVYPDLTSEEVLDAFDPNMNGLSEGDIQYFTLNFLNGMANGEEAIFTDFLQGNGIDYTLEYDDANWAKIEKAVNLVQSRWNKLCGEVPDELKLDAWKTVEGNMNCIYNYIHASIGVFKSLEYAIYYADNDFERAYHYLNAFDIVVSEIEKKVPSITGKLILGAVSGAFKVLGVTFEIASFIHEQLVDGQSVPMYYSLLKIDNSVGNSLTTPDEYIGKFPSQDYERNKIEATYMQFILERMKENYKNNTTIGNAGEIGHFGGHSYQLILDKQKWYDAQSYCESLGGHLVTLTSQEENDYVYKLSGGGIAIGLSDYDIEGSWKWVTGEEFSYKNWCPGEPNNEMNEDYALMKTNGQWNDGHLERENWAFVCEWDEYINAYPTINDEHHYIEYVNEFCEDDGYTEHVCEDCGLKYYSNHTEPIGHHYIFSKTVNPTCTAQGYDVYVCTNCDKTEKRNTVSALGHSYSYTKTIAPTCTAQGYDLYTCSVCGATTKKNTEKALGHDYETVQVITANCTEKGYTEKKCKTCGIVTKTDNVNATGHDYAVAHTTMPTCTEKGLDTYICNNCGDTYTKEVAALGHNFSWLSNTHIAPSCTDSGYTVQTCSRCGETQKTNELPATGHDYGNVPNQVYLEQVYASDHRFVDSLNYTPNTVTENTIGSTAIGSNEFLRAGWMTLPREIRLSVDDLSAVEDYYIARQRHLLSFSARVNIPAVFAYDTSTGRAPEYSAIPYTDRKGTLYELDGTGLVASLPKTEAEEKGVLNGDGTVNVPKALAQGLNIAYSAGLPGTYICLPELEFTSGFSGWNTPAQVFYYDGVGTVKAGKYTVNFCFYNEEQSGTAGTIIKVYDHAALNYTTPAKDGTPAQLHHKCIDCGEVLTEDLGFDDALKVKSASLSLGNNLIMNFKVSKEVLEGYEEPFLEVTRNGKVMTLREYTEQGDNYVFSFTNIAPQTMNDEMTAVLYASKDGQVYASSEVKTSVKTYLYNILKAYSGDQHAKLRTLLVDLLNYGAKAQQYTNYKTDSLASDDLTAEQKAWGSTGELKLNNITNVAYRTVENPVVTWKSASLILDNAVTVRYKFTADSIDGLSVKVQYGNAEKEFYNSAFESLGDGVYSLKFSGLSAHQLKEPLYATVYKDGTAVSNTLSYSVESYAAQVKDSQPDRSLDELTTALMHYGTSAIDYKNG